MMRRKLRKVMTPTILLKSSRSKEIYLTTRHPSFNDFNYLLKIDTNLFTFDIQGIRNYEEYELNNTETSDLEERWLDNGVPYQLCDHICEPYHFKNGMTKWPTCSSDIDGFCNGGELLGMDCIGSVTTWEDLVEKFVKKFYQLSNNNDEMEAEESDDPNDIVEIFKIKGNLFDYKTPLTYEEYELNNTKTSDLEEQWLDNGDHKWYDELTDGKLNEKTLMHKAKVEESWGDATPGMIRFNAWLRNSFENFHELDYNELWSSNADYTQYNQEHEMEHHDPLTCRVRRFEMIKYSFDDDDEYVAIQEHECSEHSETNIDTCQAYREIFRIMDEGWLVTKAFDE
ncbi:hypothetical protein Tco_1243136 [Tanacetum coccineum]